MIRLIALTAATIRTHAGPSPRDMPVETRPTKSLRQVVTNGDKSEDKNENKNEDESENKIMCSGWLMLLRPMRIPIVLQTAGLKLPPDQKRLHALYRSCGKASWFMLVRFCDSNNCELVILVHFVIPIMRLTGRYRTVARRSCRDFPVNLLGISLRC